MDGTSPLDQLFGGNPTSQWQQVVAKLKAGDPTTKVTTAPVVVRSDVQPGDDDWSNRVSLSAEELDDLLQNVKSLRVKDILSEARYLLLAATRATHADSNLKWELIRLKNEAKESRKSEKKMRKEYKTMKAEWDRRTEKMHEALEEAEDLRQQLRDLKGE